MCWYLMVMGKDLAKMSKCAKEVKRKPDIGGRMPGKGCRSSNGGFPVSLLCHLPQCELCHLQLP